MPGVPLIYEGNSKMLEFKVSYFSINTYKLSKLRTKSNNYREINLKNDPEKYFKAL